MSLDDRVIQTLRNQAWERIKGEIGAVLSTYWNDEDKFEAFTKLSENFIMAVEQEGCAE